MKQKKIFLLTVVFTSICTIGVCGENYGDIRECLDSEDSLPDMIASCAIPPEAPSPLAKSNCSPYTYENVCKHCISYCYDIDVPEEDEGP